jgi:hypothetical protein
MTKSNSDLSHHSSYLYADMKAVFLISAVYATLVASSSISVFL